MTAFEKPDFGSNNARLHGVTQLRLSMEWASPTGNGGGLMGRLNAIRNRTDVDLYAFVLVDGIVVDYVSPKQHTHALSGAVMHLGDVKRGTGEGGGETVDVDFGQIRDVDHDVNGIAYVAHCATGNFGNVAGAVARFYSGFGGDGVHLANVRFPLRENARTAVLGYAVRKTDLWTFHRVSSHGHAEDRPGIQRLVQSAYSARTFA